MTPVVPEAGTGTVPLQLYLVRHPPPAIAAGICYGRSDIACAPADVAATLAAVLPELPARLAGRADVAVYSSPSVRCAALAQALPGAVVAFDARLMEMDFGVWEMRAWDVIPRAEIDACAADPTGYRPGGGESVRMMAARVLAFYRELTATAVAQAASGAGAPFVAVVVCHAGTMRLLATCASDGSAGAGADADADADADTIAAIAAAAPHRYAFGAVQPIP